MKIKSLVLLISLAIFFASYLNKDNLIFLYNKNRVVFLDGGGESCLKELEKKEVLFESKGDQGTDTCPIKNAVRVIKFKDTSLSSAVILSCTTAIDTANWLNEIQARHLTHLGTINCRKRRGSGLLSEHSFGIAIDISMIDNAIIEKHWDNEDAKGNKLRKAARVACKYFSNVLTPETNKLHHNHLHLDSGIGSKCDA